METQSKTEDELLTYYRKAPAQAQTAIATLARRSALTAAQRMAELATAQKKQAEAVLAKPEVADAAKAIDPTAGTITPTAAAAEK